jgi:hypothetical protein
MYLSNRRPSAIAHRLPLLLLVAGSIALAAVGVAPAPARAQALEPIASGPVQLFSLRLVDGEFIDPYSAAFAPAPGNGYYALWLELAFEGPGPAHLQGQRFNGADLPIGTPRPIVTGVAPSAQFPRDIQLRREGSRMLGVWRRHNAPSTNVFARFLNAQGGALSPVIPIGATSSELAVALLDSGRALLVWRDSSTAAGRLVGRTLEPAGTRSTMLFLASGDSRNPALGVDAQGRFLVVWQDFHFQGSPDFDLLGRWLDSDGRPTSPPFVVTRDTTGAPALAVWPDGRSAVAWASCSGTFPQSDCKVRLRRLDDKGQPAGTLIRLSPNDGRSHGQPEVAIGPDGVLFVSWQACPSVLGGNLGECRFHAVVFDADGNRLATAPPLDITGEPVRRRVVALEDDFLVSWYSFNARPDGVFIQRYRFTPEPDEEEPPPPPQDPPPPGGVAPLTSPEFPDFRFWVQIGGANGAVPGASEPNCIRETLCVSGAVPGRSELFVRVVGPKPNGFLWPTLVKFTTSTVEVWIEQVSSGDVQYYRLPGATPGSSDLPGLFDRRGFRP